MLGVNRRRRGVYLLRHHVDLLVRPVKRRHHLGRVLGTRLVVYLRKLRNSTVNRLDLMDLDRDRSDLLEVNMRLSNQVIQDTQDPKRLALQARVNTVHLDQDKRSRTHTRLLEFNKQLRTLIHL